MQRATTQQNTANARRVGLSQVTNGQEVRRNAVLVADGIDQRDKLLVQRQCPAVVGGTSNEVVTRHGQRPRRLHHLFLLDLGAQSRGSVVPAHDHDT